MAREEHTQRGEATGAEEVGEENAQAGKRRATGSGETDDGGVAETGAAGARGGGDVLGRSAGGDGPGVVQRVEDIDVECVSAEAWRLLRTAAGYEQRAIERELDELKQAHISMLENNTRSLSTERLERLFNLYTAELTDEQVCALVELF